MHISLTLLTCFISPQTPSLYFSFFNVEKRLSNCHITHVNTEETFDQLEDEKNHQRKFAIYKYLSQIMLMQDQRYKDRAKKLEEDVRSMINNENADLLETLELIDGLKRLGLEYRFERDDITRALDKFASSKCCNERIEKSLHATALSFRLLRQQGYQVSQGKYIYIYIYLPTIMLVLYSHTVNPKTS